MLKSFKLILPSRDKELSVTAKLDCVVDDGNLLSFEASFKSKIDDVEFATLNLIGGSECREVLLYQKSNIDVCSLGAKGSDLVVLEGLEPVINKRQLVCDITRDPTPTCFASSIAILMNMPKVKRAEVEAFQVMRKLAVLLEVGFGYRDIFEESSESLEEDFESVIEPIERFYKKGLSVL